MFWIWSIVALIELLKAHFLKNMKKSVYIITIDEGNDWTLFRWDYVYFNGPIRKPLSISLPFPPHPPSFILLPNRKRKCNLLYTSPVKNTVTKPLFSRQILRNKIPIGNVGNNMWFSMPAIHVRYWMVTTHYDCSSVCLIALTLCTSWSTKSQTNVNNFSWSTGHFSKYFSVMYKQSNKQRSCLL